MRYHTPQRAFTLMELIVAVSITMLLMFLINSVFNATSRAVSRGVATGDIVSNARAVTSTFDLDAQRMVGPQDNDGYAEDQAGGVLIINQRVIGNWDENMPRTADEPDGDPPYTLDGDANGDGVLTPDEAPNILDDSHEGVLFPRQNNQFERRFVRSDQLTYFTEREPGQYPVAPAAADTLTSANDTNAAGVGLARFTRVWYGHVPRTTEEGISYVATDNRFDFPIDVPTSPGALGRGGNSDTPAINREGTGFVLGRQELFLGEEAPTGDDRLPSVLAQGVFPEASVTGYGGAIQSGYTEPPFRLHAGLTDYAYSSYDDRRGLDTNGGDAHPLGSVVASTRDDYDYLYDNDDDDMGALSFIDSTTRLWADTGVLPAPVYHNRAVLHHTYARRWLWANPQPYNPTPDDRGDDLYAWQIAQMHPYLMEHVSDFAVEFTSDLNLDGRADTIAELSELSGDAQITAYKQAIEDRMSASGAAGSTEDQYVVVAAGKPYIFPLDTVVWYTSPDLANDGLVEIHGRPFDPSQPLTFAYPNDVTSITVGIDFDNDGTPDETYSPGYDPFNESMVGTAHADSAFVFRHDDENHRWTDNDVDSTDPYDMTNRDEYTPPQASLWPHMLRLRFRMHDPRGEIESQAGQHGIWFEQIVPVEREHYPKQ